MSVLGLKFDAVDGEQFLDVELSPPNAELTETGAQNAEVRPSFRGSDLRWQIARHFEELILEIQSEDSGSDRASVIDSITSRLRVLERICIEAAEAAGPVEPAYLATLISRRTEGDLAALVVRRLHDTIRVHPEMREVSFRRIHDTVVRFCHLGVQKEMSIDVFSMRLSEFIGLALHIEMESPAIVFIETAIREALGLEGRIPNREFSDPDVTRNATRLVRAIYRSAAAV